MKSGDEIFSTIRSWTTFYKTEYRQEDNDLCILQNERTGQVLPGFSEELEKPLKKKLSFPLHHINFNVSRYSSILAILWLCAIT